MLFIYSILPTQESLSPPQINLEIPSQTIYNSEYPSVPDPPQKKIVLPFLNEDNISSVSVSTETSLYRYTYVYIDGSI